jgi:hypothetical protein
MSRITNLIALAVIVTALAGCAGGTMYEDGQPPAGAAAAGGHAGHGGGEAAPTTGAHGDGEHGAGDEAAAAEGETPADDAASGGGHAGHGGAETGDAAPAGDGEDMADMVVLAETETKDLSVELHAMPPELFYVSEGDDFRPQEPSPKDSAHLMVSVSDKESGVRLPDATVTVRITDQSGATAFEGPLYPMVGRGMGLHYGENVQLADAGRYEIELVIGPPRVGRHRAVQNAWNETTSIKQTIEFDGKAIRSS